MTITRFAPSPTGLLHIGNIRTALICFLMAKKQQCTFLLRLDDTDTERSKEAFASQIQEDLRWLELHPDDVYKQSERSNLYDQAKQTLIDKGLLYPCFETEEEIGIKRKMLLSQGKPPIYDREALTLSDAQKKQLEQEGRKPYWRFKLDQEATIAWHDTIKGDLTFQAKYLSDPVLIRANGNPTYMLPSTVDDIDMSITHVIRGEDHVNNTAVQIQLFEALGGTIPAFAHHSLVKVKDGKISKREGGYDIGALKNEGVEHLSILSYLSRLGTSQAFEAFQSIDELIEQFDIHAFGKAAAIFSKDELLRVNQKLIHDLPYDKVKDRPELDGIDADFYPLIQKNISLLSDAQDWHRICHQELKPIINDDDKEFLKSAAQLLPDGDWSSDTWSAWTASVKSELSRHGKALFLPIRLALTAKEHGPELKNILPALGKEKTRQRLNGNVI